MANQEHLDILAKGIEPWNAWREQYPNVRPDLSNASLPSAVLRGMNLKHADAAGADFSAARLTSADLTGARVTGATLIEADLRMARLKGADLTRARLIAADLGGADLKNADLSDADLSGAYLRGTRMERTSLTGARLRGTTFAEVDLRGVIGLESVRHDGPSSIGLDTIYRSQGKIPESFLRGAGVPESFVTFMRSLAGVALEFYSVFISQTPPAERVA